MKPTAPKAAANGRRPAPRAFTLVELMISMTIGMLVLAAVC